MELTGPKSHMPTGLPPHVGWQPMPLEGNCVSYSTVGELLSPCSRPVRMHMDIDTNMKMIGKRIPYYATFTVSCYFASLVLVILFLSTLGRLH